MRHNTPAPGGMSRCCSEQAWLREPGRFCCASYRAATESTPRPPSGCMPAWRTLGSAVLSVVIVGMGVSLGREGAPKQSGAVMANFFSDRVRLSDEQRRLLVG